MKSWNFQKNNLAKFEQHERGNRELLGLPAEQLCDREHAGISRRLTVADVRRWPRHFFGQILPTLRNTRLVGGRVVGEPRGMCDVFSVSYVVLDEGKKKKKEPNGGSGAAAAAEAVAGPRPGGGLSGAT